MGYSKASLPPGAVHAILVATAPDAAAQTADLLWRPVLGRPLIAWPLSALLQLDALESCFISFLPAHREDCRALVVDAPPGNGSLSGAYCRGERNWLSLLEMSGRIRDGWLVVVDATLPLVTTSALRAGLLAAERTGVAIAAEPVKETLKRVDGQVVVETLPREALRRLCPPVIFSRAAIWRVIEAYDPAGDVDANDLIALIRRADVPLTVFDANYPCVRVTSEHDLSIVESLLRRREMESSPL